MLSCLGWLILVLWFLPSAFSGPAICFLPNKRQVGSAPHLICSRSDMMVARGLNWGAWQLFSIGIKSSPRDCSYLCLEWLLWFYCLGFRAASVEGSLEIQMMLLDILSRSLSVFHSTSHHPEPSNVCPLGKRQYLMYLSHGSSVFGQ